MSIPRWVAVDDTDSSIQYYGSGWLQDQGSRNAVGNFGPAYRSTLHGTKTNASLSFAFSGTKVVVYGSNNLRNDSGVLDPTWECFVDHISIGKPAPFGAAENNWVFCKQDQLVDGPHVITVNATVMKEQTFWFDQIQYFPSPSVSLENAAVIVDNLDSAVQFGHGWADLGGIANVTLVPNSNFSFSFTGASLSWYGTIPHELPHISASGSYSVDDQPAAKFSLKGLASDADTTLYFQKFFDTSQYTVGPHKIVMTYLGDSKTTPLTLDFLIVQNGTSTTGTLSSPTSTSGSANGSKSSRHSSNIGPILGVVVGGLALIVLIILALFCLRRRRDEKRQKIKLDLGPEEYSSISPFHLGPTLSAVPDIHPQHVPQASRGGQMSQLDSTLSQNSTQIDPFVGSGPSMSHSQVQQLWSIRPDGKLNLAMIELRPLNDLQYPPRTQRSTISNKIRLEAEVTTGVLQLPRSRQEGLSLPLNILSGSTSSYLVHEDSGLRLPHPGNEGSIVEVPPVYTVG